MKQSKKFEYKRIIVLTEDYMTELQSVIQKYSRIDSIRGKTKNDRIEVVVVVVVIVFNLLLLQ